MQPIILIPEKKKVLHKFNALVSVHPSAERMWHTTNNTQEPDAMQTELPDRHSFIPGGDTITKSR